MTLRGGVLIIDNAYGERQTFATFTCKHCATVRHLTPKRARAGIINCDNVDDVGVMCPCCSSLVCLKCSLVRDTWMAKVDRMEQAAFERDRRLKEYGVV